MDNKSSTTKSSITKLSVDEILELERMYIEMGGKTLDRNFCKKIAKSFSSSSEHAGITSLSWKQVHQWFQNKHKKSQAEDTSSPEALKLSVDISDTSNLRKEHKSFPCTEGEQVADISELTFEARSSKDSAWHDVAMFLNFRVLSKGELLKLMDLVTQIKEVRVRYSGFGKEQDEWVNVNQELRVRSIPLVPSECHKVKDGDLILCFVEKDDYALYCDARVVEIQRRLHDPTECTCIFIVRYVHDNTEFLGTGYAVGLRKRNLWSPRCPSKIL
ncbi:protein SAWADEE HOMEODOMAIN HOMOLOG 1-like isoform X2 [Gastrolobium bilobum]|uniref:protein SAWADEE HOMEODOMAIN HOMOLOG 1-like isoform X2 n=1 Tax=Gastrolobium bilobum TaxID=150636 RepID=UPI002AAF22DA|nr:protein SAWADEE HOMEODOMAIN HOMOLOG 1-like isoform X2 [Gastrolobium bilobum]